MDGPAELVKLIVVGSAPAYTRRPSWPSSCYLVEDGERSLVMDMGQGTFAALAQYRTPESVGGILISHLHADHLVDLIPLRHYLRFDADRQPVELRGPAGLRQRVDSFQAEQDFLEPLSGDELQPGEFELAGFRVEARHVTHIPNSFAFRVASPAGGPGLVYSGDCGVAGDLLPLVRQGDTLLCEAAFATDEEAGEGEMHLTAAQAARVAADSGAARLVLTHILDRYDAERAREAAAEHYRGEILLAEPGLELALG